MNEFTQRTEAELRQAFKDQLDLLIHSCESFDKGKIVSGKVISTILRTLLYAPPKGNKRSRTFPLVAQLKLTDNSFLDTSASLQNIVGITGEPGETDIEGIPYCGLVEFYVTDTNASFYAPLGFRRVDQWPRIAYQKWLEKPVFRDVNRMKASRLDLIRLVADADGGSHVDAALPTYFYEWKNGITLGLNYREKDGPLQRLPNVELYALRQIAHELLRTFQRITPWACTEIDYAFGIVPNIPEGASSFRHGVTIWGGAKLESPTSGSILSSDARNQAPKKTEN
jgi:hypothetical protein